MWPDAATRTGALVLVVGPSGAGKDSILRQARARLGPGSPVVFARRVVTRPPDADENNEAATPEEFEAAVASKSFALDWSAHGLRYGIPWLSLQAIGDGAIVVVNGSRTVAARARSLVADTSIVLVTAPPAILAARVMGRARDGEPAERLARDLGPLADLRPDAMIDNSGALDRAVDVFVEFLLSPRLRHQD